MNSVLVASDPLPESMRQLLGPEVELVPLDDLPSESPESIQAVIAYGHPRVDAEVMDRLPGLKVISNHGVGVDHIELAAAAERGIAVGNTPGCLDAATADMTMALLLSIARNVRIGDRYARSPEFTEYDPSILIGQEVTGSRLGIVGLGRIGLEVARRAQAFDMPVVYCNRSRRPDVEQRCGIEYRALDDLLAESDFVSLNCPLTSETTGLIGADQFARMKPSGILINMARGPVVQTDALYQALTSGQIAAAAVDVTDPEPLPRDHPLLKVENLIVTPHLGSASNRTRERMVAMTIENLRAGLADQPLPYAVGG